MGRSASTAGAGATAGGTVAAGFWAAGTGAAGAAMVGGAAAATLGRPARPVTIPRSASANASAVWYLSAASLAMALARMGTSARYSGRGGKSKAGVSWVIL